jgi:cysteine desulfurase
MKQAPIYLDYNATSPMLPVVRETIEELAVLPLNPSSVHRYGQMARQRMEAARKTLAEYLSVWADEIIFTASATEANNMALRAVQGRKLAVAATEHSSVLQVALSQADAIILPVDSHGILQMDALEKILAQEGQGRLLVSVMLANNETGVIQPLAEIAKKVHQAGGLLHCDAVQAIGKIPVDFNLLGADMLTLSAHKAGGGIGVGALVVRNSLHIKPLLFGGGQEKLRRAGTENVAAIAGLGAWIAAMPNLAHLAKWREQLEQAILAASPDAMMMGKDAPRVPNTSCIMMPHVSSEVQLIRFDLEGICVSAGSACASGRITPSHVLQAMGVAKEHANSALRISMGWATTEAEVLRCTEVWKQIAGS